MQAEEEKQVKGVTNSNNDSDSEPEASYSGGMPLIASNFPDVKKAYIHQAEGRVQHIADSEKEIENITNERVDFKELLKIESDVVTIDVENVRRFQGVYNARDAASNALLEETKTVIEKFSQNTLMDIERGNKKKFTRNVKALDKSFAQDEEITRKKTEDKKRKTLIKIEEALNSYTIIPVEPEYSVIYKVGVLYHAKRREVIDTQEFRTAVSLRLDQIPHAFRWIEKNEKILDLSADFEKLAAHIDAYLEDESKRYHEFRQQFIKRVRGIREELDEEKVELDLEKLNALALETSLEEPAAAGIAGTEKLEKTPVTATRFYPLLPEEINTLLEIVPTNGSFSLGYSIELLAEDYHQSAK